MTVKKYITLFSTPNHKDVEEAVRLCSSLPGLGLDHYGIPPSVAEWVAVPYIKTQTGEMFYGLEGIRCFASWWSQMSSIAAEKNPLAIVSKMKEMGYRLKLTEYTDGVYAAFGKSGIDGTPWQASQMPDIASAIASAALLALGENER